MNKFIKVFKIFWVKMGRNEFFNQKNGSLAFLATCGGLIHQTTNDH
jgi:hypothetical protein